MVCRGGNECRKMDVYGRTQIGNEICDQLSPVSARKVAFPSFSRRAVAGRLAIALLSLNGLRSTNKMLLNPSVRICPMIVAARPFNSQNVNTRLVKQ